MVVVQGILHEMATTGRTRYAGQVDATVSHMKDLGRENLNEMSAKKTMLSSQPGALEAATPMPVRGGEATKADGSRVAMQRPTLSRRSAGSRAAAVPSQSLGAAMSERLSFTYSIS